MQEPAPVETETSAKAEAAVQQPAPVAVQEEVKEESKPAAATTLKPYEEMTIEELQEAILERMRKNGPVTDQMKKDVMENVYHNSLVTWIKSFN